MAIRLRRVTGKFVALCAVETDPMPGDVYLDDGEHDALYAKFARDHAEMFGGEVVHCEAAASQVLRNAKEELEKWDAAGRPGEDVSLATALPFLESGMLGAVSTEEEAVTMLALDVESIDPDRAARLAAALRANEARADEDVDLWAARLAADVAEADD